MSSPCFESLPGEVVNKLMKEAGPAVSKVAATAGKSGSRDCHLSSPALVEIWLRMGRHRCWTQDLAMPMPHCFLFGLEKYCLLACFKALCLLNWRSGLDRELELADESDSRILTNRKAISLSALYPGHSFPTLVHRLHSGFVSSHCDDKRTDSVEPTTSAFVP